MLIVRNRQMAGREETHSLESSLVTEAKVNMSPPWGHRRALFPTADTGLHLVGFLLKRDKEDQHTALPRSTQGHARTTAQKWGMLKKILVSKCFSGLVL